MPYLIVSPTILEIRSLLEKFTVSNILKPYEVCKLNDNIHILVSGPGSLPTIYHLTKVLCENNYDWLIQSGLAGSFNPALKHGQIVEVSEDCFADLGIDDRGQFRSLFDIGLEDPDEPPFNSGSLLNPDAGKTGLSLVKAVSVNTVSGSISLIEQRKALFNSDIETMEGAAFFYTCLQEGIPFFQIRAISNMVEPRNRDSWEMDLALKNLNNWLINFVNDNS